MLEINNRQKAYGQRQVLQGLMLHIEAGEIYGLLGPNGSGKTTTINILCNLLNAATTKIHAAFKISNPLKNGAFQRI